MSNQTSPSQSAASETIALREGHVSLPEVTDEIMRKRLSGTRAYTVVILKEGSNYRMAGADRNIWAHAKRTMALRLYGPLSIVCPVTDNSEVCGVSIFDADPAVAQEIMAGDPAVLAGVLRFEVHPVLSFPGDSLPG